MYKIIGKIKLKDKEFVLDQTNLISVALECYDRDDLSKPSWGIIANGGSVEFVDYDGTIAGYAEKNVFKTNYPIEFYLIDDDGNETIVATKYTKHWEYDNDNYNVQVELGDIELEKLQDIQIEANPFSLDKFDVNVTMESFYEYIIFSVVPANLRDNLNASTVLTNNAENYLKNITVKYFYSKAGSIWSVLDEWCKAVNVHMLVGRDGSIKMYYNGGN